MTKNFEKEVALSYSESEWNIVCLELTHVPTNTKFEKRYDKKLIIDMNIYDDALMHLFNIVHSKGEDILTSEVFHESNRCVRHTLTCGTTGKQASMVVSVHDLINIKEALREKIK